MNECRAMLWKGRTIYSFDWIPEPVEFKQTKSAKKIHIKISSIKIEVSVPIQKTIDDALVFFESNREWVKSQLHRSRSLSTIRRAALPNETTFMYLGNKRQVLVVLQRRLNTKIVSNDSIITINTNDRCLTRISPAFERWARSEAKKVFLDKLSRAAERFGVKCNRLLIMDQKTKWGNCSRLGNISINWRLLMAPEYVIEYIAHHEVLHLKIPDHSSKFWLTLKSTCKQTDNARQWLVRNGSLLLSWKLSLTNSST